MPQFVKPFGDLPGDGMVQLSFTLPVPHSPEGRSAAIEFLKKMGFEKILVAAMETIDKESTFFVAYGNTTHEIDFASIHVLKLENPLLSFDEINKLIEEKIGRKLVVVGACIGSDAHTVGIDAIFNMKGFAHDWGFERYPWFFAHNLRAQVSVNELVKKIIELSADAVLVSRVVTQRDEHIVEFNRFLEAFRNTPGVNPQLIKICGGPRITHEDALKWGYDAGFGPGTKPSQVASFIVHQFLKNRET